MKTFSSLLVRPKSFSLVILLLTICIQSPSTSLAKVEPWYLEFAFGGASPKFHNDVQNDADTILRNGGKRTMTAGTGEFGVYFSVTNNWALGVAIASFGQSYKESAGTPNQRYVTMFQSCYNISSVYYLGSEIGSGVFLRGDLGFGWLNKSAFNVASDDKMTENIYGGSVYMAGTGYSFPINDETRLFVAGTYAHIDHGGGQKTTAILYQLGILW